MDTTNNLWGNLPLAEDFRPPISILREQANKLTHLTAGLLEGEVSPVKSSLYKDKPLSFRLNIVVPALESYSFAVLRVYHSILLYPVLIKDVVNDIIYECEDEDYFVISIEKILTSASVHRAISALLAQSRAENLS